MNINDYPQIPLTYPLEVFVTAYDMDNCICSLNNYSCDNSEDFEQLTNYLMYDSPSAEDRYEMHIIKDNALYTIVHTELTESVHEFILVKFISSKIPISK